MNELRDELLPAAAFAGDEHRRVRGSNATREFQRALERRRAAEDLHHVAVAVFAGESGLLRQGFAGHHDGMRGAADEDLQVCGRKRLGQVIPGADAQRLEARVDARIPGDHDRDRIGTGRETAPQQVHP